MFKMQRIRTMIKCSNVCKFKDRKEILKMFRVFAWILCLSGFLYQTSQLVSLFFSGKTIAENRVEKLKFTKLPAITICLPFFMSFQRFSETYPQYQQLYKNYTHLVKRNKWDKQDYSNYDQFFETFLKAYKDEQVPIGKMFELAINYLDDFHVDITVFDEQDQLIYISEKRKWFRSLWVNAVPRICFTTFSDLDDKYRVYKTQMREINIEIRHNNMDYSHYYLGSKGIYVSLHSANLLPDYKEGQTFQKIQNGKVNLISYSEIHTTLLPSPYETNCKTYEMETNEQNMRSDCVMKCITNRILKECDLKCLNSWDNYNPIREMNAHEYYDYPICDSDKFKINGSMVGCVGWKQAEFEAICEKICPKNCFEIHYDFVIRPQSWGRDWDVYGLKIIHDQHPDQIVDHRPIMTWLELVSSCGGLLGMWLGVSFAIIFEQVLSIFKR